MSAAPETAAAVTWRERGLRFDCEGWSLLGVLATPEQVVERVGVVVAVGGPQYRAGSHRQFALLARALATQGFPSLRFDARGMGDSEGDFPGFEHLGPDLAAAGIALRAACPNVDHVVYWGLCDAASALLINAERLPHAAGLVLLNPWARHETTIAQTQVRHYYARRVFEAGFWRKLLGGGVALGPALREFAAKVREMRRARRGLGGDAQPVNADYRETMARGALGFAGPQLYVLSGRDHTCAEFVDYVAVHPRAKALWTKANVRRLDLPEADHTFSSAGLRAAVERATLAFVRDVAATRAARHR